MHTRFVPARRHRSSVAARVIALAGLVAVMAALAFGSLHTTGDAAPMTGAVAHAALDATHADAGCATCGEHEGGVMAACLMVLVIVVMMSSTRGMPHSWEIRIPARERRWAPRTLHRPMTPSLNVLCICRT